MVCLVNDGYLVLKGAKGQHMHNSMSAHLQVVQSGISEIGVILEEFHPSLEKRTPSRNRLGVSDNAQMSFGSCHCNCKFNGQLFFSSGLHAWRLDGGVENAKISRSSRSGKDCGSA